MKTVFSERVLDQKMVAERFHYFTNMSDTDPVTEPALNLFPEGWSWNLIEQLHIVRTISSTVNNIRDRTCCFTHLFTVQGQEEQHSTFFCERLAADGYLWPGQEDPLTHIIFQCETTKEVVDAAPLDFEDFYRFFVDRCNDVGTEVVQEDALRKSLTERRPKLKGLYEFMGPRSVNHSSYAIHYEETHISVIELPDVSADDTEEALIRYAMENKFITGNAKPTCGHVLLKNWVKYDYP